MSLAAYLALLSQRDLSVGSMPQGFPLRWLKWPGKTLHHKDRAPTSKQRKHRKAATSTLSSTGLPRSRSTPPGYDGARTGVRFSSERSDNMARVAMTGQGRL